MIRLAVITDLHANLPALQAALGAIASEGCDAIYHTGDAITIGPHNIECLDVLLGMPNAYLLKGNHDRWLVEGLPQPQPEWMDDGEVVHQRWVHAQLGPPYRDAVARWSMVIQEVLEGVRVTFLHYALGDAGDGFAPILHRPSAVELDRMFALYEADVLFYGHTHVAWDVQGRARYVNPGSLGCCAEALARFVVLECERGGYEVLKYAVPYDDGPLYEAFEDRQVPVRQFLYRAFFGSRFPPSQDAPTTPAI